MLVRQRIAELYNLLFRMLSRIWSLDAVVQMYLDFSPTIAAVLGQCLDQIRIVLFGRIKIRVIKGPSFCVPPTVQNTRNLSKPRFNPPLLLTFRSAGAPLSRNNARFKMISQR